MEDFITELKSDLTKKLNNLCSTHDQPALFVSEHFFDLRNSIDYDAERELNEPQSHEVVDEEDANELRKKEAAINSVRSEFIKFLKQMEQKAMDELPAKSKTSDEVYASIKERVEKFILTNADQDFDLNRYENEYSLLCLEMFKQMCELEKRLLGNQTIFYVSSNDKLGALCVLPNDFLNKHEINSIK